MTTIAQLLKAGKKRCLTACLTAWVLATGTANAQPYRMFLEADDQLPIASVPGSGIIVTKSGGETFTLFVFLQGGAPGVKIKGVQTTMPCSVPCSNSGSVNYVSPVVIDSTNPLYIYVATPFSFPATDNGICGGGGGTACVDLDDVLCALAGFTKFGACPSADIFPCGGDGHVDLQDILAFLNRFGGSDSCGVTCDGSNPRIGVTSGLASLANIPTVATPRYLGEFTYTVSINCAGSAAFMIPNDPDSLLRDAAGMPVPFTTDGAQIEIVGEACCLPNGHCIGAEPAACSALGGGPQGPGSICLGDSNGDGVDQLCEGDCDGDRILDGDETNPAQRDCDQDGICNGVEIANCPPGNSSCADCNANGIPDGCEADCNNNQIADGCDIANCSPGDALCADCNANGIPDACEAGACCISGGGCFVASPNNCLASGGIWRGLCAQCPPQTISVAIVEPGGSVFNHIISAPVECPPPPPPAVACTPGQPFTDPWESPESGSMCHNFGVGPESPAIPAGFFGAGSDAFSGAVCLKGSSLEMSPFGDADTLIRRTGDPFDRCSLPSATPAAPVPIEVIALRLVSVSTMTVTYNVGQSPEPWNVAVDLSPTVTPPAGMLTAVKSHCNGGTYTSTLNVQPRFTFTKVSDPMQVRVLDTGAVMPPIPYVTLDQTTPAPWVHDVDPNLGLMGDPCSAFHAGVSQQNPQTQCDCNGNTIRDACDIETNFSLDCQPDGVPDECQLVGNDNLPPGGDGIPDQCNCSSDAQCSFIDDSNVCTCRKCANAVCGHVSIEYGDVNCGGGMPPVDLDDILCTLAGFGGFANCPNGDIHPSCNGNDVIDLDDIIAVLNAFGGFDPCTCTS